VSGETKERLRGKFALSLSESRKKKSGKKKLERKKDDIPFYKGQGEKKNPGTAKKKEGESIAFVRSQGRERTFGRTIHCYPKKTLSQEGKKKETSTMRWQKKKCIGGKRLGAVARKQQVDAKPTLRGT